MNLKRKTFLKRIIPYIAIGCIAIFLIIILNLILGIYPFGDKCFLWVDSDQYLGFEHYLATMLGKNNLLYSWNNVLGQGVLPQMAYYSLSPFNVLFIIFNNHMIFAVHIITYTKIICCACAFYFYLQTMDSKNELLFMRILLSLCYAFMGYIIFYGWNASWFDGVMLLPLMSVGIQKLVKNKNKSIYIISIAVSLISNFYIGYMLCITSFLLYIFYLMAETQIKEALKKTFIGYIFCSIIGCGMSALVLIPTYLGIPKERRLSLKELFESTYLTVSPSDILSGVFTGQVNSLNANAPIIFIGMLPIVLIIMYFLNRDIAIKNKLRYSVFILALILSFENSFINIMWHGFSKNAWFNYRYSFVLSFIMLVLAYESACLFNSCTLNLLAKVGGIVIVSIFLVLSNASDKINMFTITLDILFVLLLLMLFGFGTNKKIVKVLLFIQVLIGIEVNGYYVLKDYDFMSCEQYHSNKDIMETAFSIIDDDSFYRMEKNFIFSRCDANLFNYNGITNYASTENTKILRFVKQLGGQHDWMWACYTSNMPMASESLLGMKYILADTINGKGYENIGSYKNITFYKNTNALPIIFPALKRVDDDFGLYNDFEIQNMIWKSIGNSDVFVKNTCIPILDEKGNITNSFDIEVNSEGSVYLYIPRSSYSVVSYDFNGNNNTISYNENTEIYYIGEYTNGDHIICNIAPSDGSVYDTNNEICYTEQEKVVKLIAQDINAMNVSINEISSSHLEISYIGDNNLLASTIPYDEGWVVYDNGKKIEIERNWNNFIAFKLNDDKKDHVITMTYIPKGLKMGFVISISSGLLFILYEIYIKRKMKNGCL